MGVGVVLVKCSAVPSGDPCGGVLEAGVTGERGHVPMGGREMVPGVWCGVARWRDGCYCLLLVVPRAQYIRIEHCK